MTRQDWYEQGFKAGLTRAAKIAKEHRGKEVHLLERCVSVSGEIASAIEAERGSV